MKSTAGLRRPYRQVARAAAAEVTAERIVRAFAASARDRWLDEITLEEVAASAGVTPRTVIRRFGGKDGLIRAYMDYIRPIVREVRRTTPGDVETAIARLTDFYEKVGDRTVRDLAQEPLQPALKPLLEMGRREHRALTAEAYAPWLDRLIRDDRRRIIDALVAATDVYVWKLFRRDMGRSAKETLILIRGMVEAILVRAEAITREAHDE